MIGMDEFFERNFWRNHWRKVGAFKEARRQIQQIFKELDKE